MATELVSFGVQKLWDLLSQEYQQFQGVDDQVTELKGDLNMLKSFLKDADARKQTSAVVRNCVEEIKGIICDAEDIIETFLLKEKFRKTSGIKKRINRLACFIPDRRELALDIEGISKRISKVIQVMQSFGVHQIIADGSYMQPLHDRQRAVRQTFSKDYESDLVGLESNVNKLVGYLVKEDNVQVVSITGMGGVGKTTLARQVFNHEDVKQQFDGLSWVCVSQDFTPKNVWQKILMNLKPKEEEKKILDMTESTLQGELFGLLETSKSLIVVDDIWKEEDWDLIKPIFHPSSKGCKVLLTSRNESVAMRGDTTYINFKPDCLNDEDRWTLFQRIAHPRKDASEFKVDEEMEEMGKQMIKHTGGLPLAIKVLGGFLAAKYTLKDWKIISVNVGSHIVEGTHSNEDNNSSVYHVLSMSFEELPNHLKYCFLYLAHFPEDYLISVENLSYYWAAEGVPKPRHYDGETIRDVGDSYIEELVRRNMVISERDSKTLRFETCHLHDTMRELCLFKAREENFLQITSSRPSTTNFQSPVISRRLVCQYPTTLHVERDINNPKLRSLVVLQVNDVWGEGWELSGSKYTRLELLRVLHLYKAKFRGGKLPSGIGKLIHLRYLSLKGAEVSHLPSSLGNLVLLIYLNLARSVHMGRIFMPNVLMGMQELRYLALPRKMRRKTKLELTNLVNLETLKNFSTSESSIEDLRGMANLRTLTIISIAETSIQTLSASIGGLKHLENLRINHYGTIRRNVEEIVLDFVHLKKLKLDICMPGIPKEEYFPSHLTILDLSRCCWEEDPMPVLEKLLELKEVSLRYASFCGRRMVCSRNGFPQLQMLLIVELEELEEWIVEEGSMPLLHSLKTWGCPELDIVPDGLRFLYSLKELCVDIRWKARLSEGGHDYDKVKHIPSLKYVFCSGSLVPSFVFSGDTSFAFKHPLTAVCRFFSGFGPASTSTRFALVRHPTGFHQFHRESEPPSFSPSRLSPPSQKLVPPFIAPPFPNPTSCRRCLLFSLIARSSACSFSASVIVLPLLFPQVCSYHSLSDSSILGSYWMGVESVALALWNPDLVLTISMIVDSGLMLSLLMNFDPFGSPFVLSDGTLIALVRPFTAVCSPFTAVCSSFPGFILDIGIIKIGLLPLWHIGLTLLMSIHPVNLVDFSSVEYVPKGFVPFIRMGIYGFVDVAWEVQSLFRAEPPHFGTRRQVLFPKFPLVWSGLDDQASPVLKGSSSRLMAFSALVAEFVTLWVALDAVTREAFEMIVLFRSPLVFVVELYFQSISILPYCSVLSCFSCIVILYFTFVMVVIPPLLSEVET